MLLRATTPISWKALKDQFGQGFDTDIYNGAFTIPDLLFFLIIGSVEEEAQGDERAYLRLMLERRVEGLIVAGPTVTTPSTTRPCARRSTARMRLRSSASPNGLVT